MSEPTSSLAFLAMYLEVSEYNYAKRSGLSADQIAECKRWVNGAQTIFAGEHPWTFLHPQASMTLWADATGTMSVSTTTITAAAAAFYPSMIGHTLVADTSENEYTITAYTSSTVVTVDTSAAVDDGDTFTVTANGFYSLPDDCASIMGNPSYEPGGDAIGTLVARSPDFIRHRHSGTVVTGNPREFAEQPREFDKTVGQRRELYVYPIPQSDRVIEYQYDVIQADMVADTDMPLGGGKHCWTIVAGALALAEQKKNGGPGAEAAIYARRLENSKLVDDRNRPRNKGYNSNVRVPVGQGALTFDGYTA